MIKTINKEELASILGVKISTIRSIESRGQLENKLIEKGYKLVRKTKKSRSYIYEVERKSQDKELLNNMSVAMFDTKNDIALGDYVLYRMYNINKPITKQMLSNWCKVERRTIGKWDGKMIENGFLTKDGYFYILVVYDDNGNKTFSLTDKYEYNSYIRNSKYAKQKQKIAERYKKDLITYDEMELAIAGINDYAKMVEKKFVYKVNKFNIVKNNELFKEFIHLIENTRTDNKVYYQNWLKSVKKS